MKERTLVCIISQTREHEIVWNSFKSNVLDELNADLALCISVPNDYDYSNPYWQHAKYKWTCPEYSNWMDAFDYAKEVEFPNDFSTWKELLLSVEDNWCAPINGHQGAGAILIFFRWLLLRNLKIEGVLEKYDRFIVTRSDYFYMSPHPQMELLPPEFLWLPDGEYYGSVTDRYAVLSRSNVEEYLNILNNMIQRPLDMFQAIFPKANLERVVQQNLELQKGPGHWRFFPFIMYSVRSEGESTRWSLGEWNDELGYYVKYPSERFLATQNATKFTNKQDWIEWAKSVGTAQ